MQILNSFKIVKSGWREIVLGLGCLLILSSCNSGKPGSSPEASSGKNSPESSPSSPHPGTSVTPAPSSSPTAERSLQWNGNHYKNRYFDAKVRTLSPEDQGYLNTTYAGARVEALNVAKDLGYSLYTVKGIPSLSSDVFVSPRILVKSESFGGRIFVEKNNDGQGLVRFQIALVDGLKGSLATGYSRIDLPKQFRRLSEPKELEAKVGFKPALRSSFDCPETLELADGEASLPLKISSATGVCPRNQFIEVVAEGEAGPLKEWFEKRVPKGTVKLQAQFQTKAYYPIQYFGVEFDPVPVFESLLAGLEPQNVIRAEIRADRSENFSRIQVHERIRRLFQQIFGSSDFPGLTVAERDEATDVFIEKFYNLETSQCPAGEESCFHLKTRLERGDFIHIEFVREKSFDIPGFSIQTEASIQDLAQDVQLFVVQGENSDDALPPKNGKIGGLLRQVAPGDIVVLEISEILALKKTQDPSGVYLPERSNLENQVCTNYGPVPMRDEPDYNSCGAWNQSCAEWRTICNQPARRCIQWTRNCCKMLSHGGGDYCFDQTYTDPASVAKYDPICTSARCSRDEEYCAAPAQQCVRMQNTSCNQYGTKSVPAGPAPCVQQENQWVKTYGLSQVTSIYQQEEPLEKLDQKSILTGIGLRFSSLTWDEEHHQFQWLRTSCPLTKFFPELQQKDKTLEIRFRIQNSEPGGCVPFDSNNTQPGYYPEVSIVNSLSIPDQLPCGFREDYWNGTSTYSCPQTNQRASQPLFETYYPRMEIHGRLKLPGLTFISNESEETR